MRVRTFLLCLGCALLLALPALSQGIPTGTLSGRVTADNQSLPGVTVTASSPSLQGKRSATTNSNGDYTIPLLPRATTRSPTRSRASRPRSVRSRSTPLRTAISTWR